MTSRSLRGTLRVHRGTFDPLPSSVPAVRELLAAVAPLPEDVFDRAMLVVSELATNAIEHAKGAFGVRVELLPSLLRIEVTDNGQGVPELQPLQTPPSLRGRGLQIVEHASDRWGTVASGAGGTKTIWAEVDLGRSIAAGVDGEAAAQPEAEAEAQAHPS